MSRLLQRANRQLRVNEDARAEELIKAGYIELDPKTGKPLKAADPEKDLKKENAALKAENAELKAKVEKLTAKAEKAAKKGAEKPEKAETPAGQKAE